MTRRSAALLAGLALLGARPVAAQTTVPANASVTIPTVLFIDLTNPSIGFGTATAADLEAGVMTAATTSTLTHKGNQNHAVEIEATTASMVNADGTNPTVKPTTDLELSVDGGANWIGVGPTGTAAQLLTAVRGAHAATVQYRMTIGYDDAPDTYTLDFNYTIVLN